MSLMPSPDAQESDAHATEVSLMLTDSNILAGASVATHDLTRSDSRFVMEPGGSARGRGRRPEAGARRSFVEVSKRIAARSQLTIAAWQ
jgi:hypothetical protein